MSQTLLDLDDAANWFRDFAKKMDPGQSWKPALLNIKEILIEDTRRGFESQTSPDGVPWLPRMASPAMSGLSGTLLRRSDLLFRSLTQGGSQHSIINITDTTLLYGTSVPYAKLHQEGGTIVPTRARALAIPWSQEAASAGGPRTFGTKLGLIWSGGHGWLVERRAGATKIHYILFTRVTIKQREFLGIGQASYDRIDMAIVKSVVERLFGARP